MIVALTSHCLLAFSTVLLIFFVFYVYPVLSFILQSPHSLFSCLLSAFCLRCSSDPVPIRRLVEGLPRHTGCKTLVCTDYAAYLFSMT